MTTIDLLKARRERIIQFAADHGAHNVRVFGSVARGEASSPQVTSIYWLRWTRGAACWI